MAVSVNREYARGKCPNHKKVTQDYYFLFRSRSLFTLLICTV